MSDNRNELQGGAGQDTRNYTGPVVICPKCQKKHYSAYALMDAYIDCECGFSFYAFVDKGLRIMMTPQEANFEPIARAMRRFVVATGRCQDIDPRLLEYTDGMPSVDVQERDLDEEVTRALEDYQLAAFGECYITKELIDSICKAFERNYDVALNKKKDGVDVREVNKPTKVKRQEASARSTARILSYNAFLNATKGNRTVAVDGGIMRMRQDADYIQPGQ